MGKVKIIPKSYIDKIIESNPNASLLVTEYNNEKTMLEIYCKKHDIKYTHSLKNAIRHNGCPECKKEKGHSPYTTDEFKEKVFTKNPHIEILGEYTKQGCHIPCRCKIHNVDFSPSPVTLLYGNGGCPICTSEAHSKQRIKSAYIKQKFHELNPTLTIVDEEVKLNTFVKVYCSVCKNYFDKKIIYPYIDEKECKCLVCLNKIIITGYNDITTIRPDLIKYFINKDDAKKYGSGTTQKLLFKCPYCGYLKEMSIEVLSRQGFGCPCCGDGISYPNKFVRNFVRQLDVDNVDFEYSSDWTNGYFYDCYFEYKNKKYIIEIDGQQHYKKSSYFKMSIEEVKDRDKEKDLLAEKNNIILIRIDAQKSQKDYIVENIKQSILSDIFDLKRIDWGKCEEFALSNLAREICIYVENKRPCNYNEIRDRFKIGKDTIRKYLNQGVEHGWCSEKALEKLTVPKRINVYDMSNNLLYSFIGIKMCSDEMFKIYNTKFTQLGISNNCHGITDNYNGFIFKFAYQTND